MSRIKTFGRVRAVYRWYFELFGPLPEASRIVFFTGLLISRVLGGTLRSTACTQAIIQDVDKSVFPAKSARIGDVAFQTLSVDSVI